MPDLNKIGITTFPKAQHVYLEIFGSVEEPINAPELKSFACNCTLAVDSKLPFHQLKSIDTFDYGDDTPLCEFFNACTIADTMTLRPWKRIEKLKIPSRIRSLSVVPSESPDTNSFLCLYECGADLTSLSVRGGNTDYKLIFADFQKFVVQSGCSLTTLSFDSIWISTDDLLRMFELLPMLTGLKLRDYDSGDVYLRPEVLTRLRATTLDGLKFRLVPLLSHLELDVFCNQVTDEELVETFVGRALDSLQQLTLHMQDRPFKRSVFNGLRDVTGPFFTAKVTGSKRATFKKDHSDSEDWIDWW
jgi:hypothetical protein